MSPIKTKLCALTFAILLFAMDKLQAQASCAEATSISILNANNVSAELLNGGDLWWDLVDFGYNVPVTEPVGPIFNGALWIGGIDDFGQLRVAAQTYRQSGNDFWPGPINSGTGDVAGGDCADYDIHWKVTRADILNHQSFSVPVSLIDIPDGIKTWPALGNIYAEGPAGPITITEELAPFVDVDSDGIYDPTAGDYPNVPGDQAVFWVFNDVGNVHTQSGGEALGLEIRALAYAYASGDDAINNATFYRYEVVNKQSYQLDSVYIGHFVDIDMGAFDDDFVGCDTMRNLAIGYNGDAVDGPTNPNYGTEIPIVAVDLLKGPLESSTSSNRAKMSSFISYDNDFSVTGNPEVAVHYWRYLKGVWKDGTSLTRGGDGYGGSIPVKHMYPDAPSMPLPSWSQCSEVETPFDYRFIMSTGPVTMEPGYKSTIDYAVIWVRQGPLDQTGCNADWNQLFNAEAVVQGFFDSQICTGAYTDDLSLGIFSTPKESIALELAPNPAKDHAMLSWSSAHTGRVTVKISSIIGQEIYTDELLTIENRAESLRLPTDQLQKGVYVVTLSVNDKIIGMTKLLK